MKDIRQSPILSIVVIGRNEANNLPRCFNSLKPLAKIMNAEIIYVDSASTDSSIGIAKAFATKVMRLGQSDKLSASAGRYVGTLVARGTWILYLDGDMELTPEFRKKIHLLITSKRAAPEVCGYIGRYDNYYTDGSIRRDLLRQDPRGEKARCFGGAVLLLRDRVLAVGSWDYRLFSYEELDLHTRLLQQGHYVKYINIPMIKHYTRRESKLIVLFSMFVPTAVIGKKYFGIGQVIRSRVKKGSLFSFVRFFPYPFIYLGLLLLGSIWSCAVPSWSALGLIPLIIALAYVVFVRGITSAVVYLALIPQICIGFFAYPCLWEPSYEEVWSHPQSGG